MEEELFLATKVTTDNAYKLVFEAGGMLLNEMTDVDEEVCTYVAEHIGGLFERIEQVIPVPGHGETVIAFGEILKPVTSDILDEYAPDSFLAASVGATIADATNMVVAKLMVADSRYDGGEALPSIDMKAGISPLVYFKNSRLTAERMQGLIFEFQQSNFSEDKVNNREDLVKVRYLRSLNALIDVRTQQDPELASGKKPVDIEAIMGTAHRGLALADPDVEPYASEMDMSLAHHYVCRYLG